MPQAGSLFDGSSARRHAVMARAEGGQLLLEMDTGWSDKVASSILTKVSEDKNRVRLGRSDMPGWALILDKPIDPTLATMVPRGQGYGRIIDRYGLIPALVVCTALTVAVVATGYLAPHWVAPYVPMSWERKLGSAIVGDFGRTRCNDAEGQRTLEMLAEKLEPGITKGPDAIQIVALDVPIFNAVALPGGNIIVLDGAIDEADNPDALAGIIAHEIAHVRRRHVTEALIRELGIGALIGMFAGSTAAGAQQLLALSYTRAHEAEADGDAILKLRRANISPAPTSDLFGKLSKESGEEPGFTGEFLESHPLSASRAKRFADAVQADAKYAPSLTRQEYDAIRLMCRG